MQAVRDAGEDGFEILPVVVVMRAFPARPSSVPDIRDFVRQELATTVLSGEDIRVLCQRVAHVLLEAAGTGGMIQVALRIFGGNAEVDVLQINQDQAIGNTGAVTAVPQRNGGSRRPDAGAVPSRNGTRNRNGNGNGAARPEPESDRGPVPTRGVIRRPDVPFAEWLADALRREGMTMEAAARELKVSVKTVSRWVGGVTEPRLRDLSRLRDLLGDLPFP